MDFNFGDACPLDDDDLFENDADRAAADLDHFVEEAHSNPDTGDYDRVYGHEDDIDEDNYDGVFDRSMFCIQSKDWESVATNELPIVTIDQAREDLWDHTQNEIQFLLKALSNTEGISAADDLEKLVHLLCGDKSHLFHAYTQIIKESTFEDFAQWFSAFLFSCSMNMNYVKMCEHPRIMTDDLCCPTQYNKIWNRIEKYGKGHAFKQRGWELIQSAFNQTMTQNFMPSPKDVKLQLCLDDDKQHFNYQSLRKIPVDEESGVSRQHHTQVNKHGFNNHVLSLSGSGLPMQIQFQKTGYTVFDTFLELCDGLFNLKRNKIPDLTGWATLNADRQYTRLALLDWWTKTGGDYLGTVMRQGWYPFTYGKKQSQNNADSGQQNLPIDEAKCVYQKTLKHAFGKSSSTAQQLTATAYRSGTSSVVNLAIHSECHQPHWDLVAANPAELKTYQSSNTSYDCVTQGLRWLCGATDPFLEKFGKFKDDEDRHERARLIDEALEGADGDDAHALLVSNCVRLLTISQLDLVWWLLRALCFTSSTSDKIIKAFAKLIGEDHPLREAFEIVLGYSNNLSLLPNNEEVDDNNAENGDGESIGAPNNDAGGDFMLSANAYELFDDFLHHLVVDKDDVSNREDGDGGGDGDGNIDGVMHVRGGGGGLRTRPTSKRKRKKNPKYAGSDDSSSENSSEGQQSSKTVSFAQEETSVRSKVIALRNGESSESEDEDEDDCEDNENDGGDGGSDRSGSDGSGSDGSNSDSSNSSSDSEDDTNHLADQKSWKPKAEEAEEFLDIFRYNFRNANDNEEFIQAAAKYIESVDIRFVNLCTIKLGTAGKMRVDRARAIIIAWIKGSPEERSLLFLTKKQLIEKAAACNKNISSSLKVGEYRMALAKALRGETSEGDEDSDDVNNPELHLATEILSAAFLKRQKKGNNEGESKYTLRGQRAEEPLLQQFFNHLAEDDGIETIYRTGLVMKKNEHYVRDSPDAVAIVNEEEGKTVYPVEVKGRVSPRTYHQQRQKLCKYMRSFDRGSQRDSLAPVDQFDSIEIDADSEDLRGLVQSDHELLQVLHHAYTFSKQFCYLLIGDKRKLLAVIKIYFPRKLLEAYEDIIKFAFDDSPAIKFAHDVSQEHTLPEVPTIVYEAFKTKKLKHLKMTKDSFNSFMGLWSKMRLEIRTFYFDNKDAQIRFPILTIARSIPINVSYWNCLKPGGDTITKHIDNCQERVGVRTENNIVCSRIFQYFSVIFHRFKQMISAKHELESYPTLHHYRDAANHRSTMKQSQEMLSTMLLKIAKINVISKELAEEMPAPTGVFAPSPATNTEEIPEAKAMPHATAKTGKSPGGRGRSMDKHHVDFVKRCVECDGLWFATMTPPLQDKPQDPEWSESDDDSDRAKKGKKGKKGKKQKKMKRIRRQCRICNRRTNCFCNGCRSWLCDSPPPNNPSPVKNTSKKTKKKSTTQSKKEMKYPTYFYVDVPVLDANGSVQTDAEGKPVYVREYGEYSCYLIAHRKHWKTRLYNKQLPIIQNSQQDPDQEKKRKRGRSR